MKDFDKTEENNVGIINAGSAAKDNEADVKAIEAAKEAAEKEALAKADEFKKALTESNALISRRINTPEKFYQRVSNYYRKSSDNKRVWKMEINDAEIDDAVKCFDEIILPFLGSLENNKKPGDDVLNKVMLKNKYQDTPEYISVNEYMRLHIPQGRMNEDEKKRYAKALIVRGLASPTLYGNFKYNLPLKVNGNILKDNSVYIDIPSPDLPQYYKDALTVIHDNKNKVQKDIKEKVYDRINESAKSASKKVDDKINEPAKIESEKTEIKKASTVKEGTGKKKKSQLQYKLDDMAPLTSNVVRDKYKGMVSEDMKLEMATQRAKKIYSKPVGRDNSNNLKTKTIYNINKKSDRRTINLDSVSENKEIGEDTAYYSEVNRIYGKVLSNQKIEDNDRDALLDRIKEVAETKSMEIEELGVYIDSKMSAYEIVKIENDRKRKLEEDKKILEAKWEAKAMIAADLEDEPLIEESVTEDFPKSSDDVTDENAADESMADESIENAEYNRAYSFIKGADEYNEVRSAILAWIIDIDDRLNDITSKSPDDRYLTGAFKRFAKAVGLLRKNISDDSCTQGNVVYAFHELKGAACAYRNKHDEPDSELGKIIASIRDDVADNMGVIANTYDNVRRTVMYENKGKVSYANLPAGQIMLHQSELMEKYGVRDSGKEFVFEAMNEVSKAQLELRKKITKISATFEKEYEFSKSKASYLGIKRNAKTADFAKYYICSRYLDKVYAPDKCVADAEKNISEIREFVDSFDIKNVKKEIEVLSKNKIFKSCIEMNGKNAFSEWAAIEKESDALKAEYDDMLRQMGGDDIYKLSEYAMNARTFLGDDITADNRRKVAGLVCEDVGKVIALKILTDPKLKVVLNAACLEHRAGNDSFKELAESAGNYLKSKGYFNYMAGEENDAKCMDKIKEILGSSRIKANILKNFEQLQTAKINEAHRVRELETGKNVVADIKKHTNVAKPI